MSWYRRSFFTRLFPRPAGLAALSLLTSGKYVIDPELRGAEFERITQNLDMQFWKSFWNLTESGVLAVGRVNYPSANWTPPRPFLLF